MGLVAQSCPPFCNTMDCNPPGSSVHGGSSGQNAGVGCHVLQRDLPNLGIEPRSPALQVDSLLSVLKFMSIELVILSNRYFILCYSLLIMPSIVQKFRAFFNELALYIRWPKYWSFRVSNSSSNEYSALIFFRIDWLDLLVVQGTLKSLLQHHRSKASILRRSAFFMV